MQKVEERIIKPTIEGLQKEEIHYQGFIFFGLMNVGGNPWVIEYNCRLGDPESEAVIPRIKSDLLDLLGAVKNQELNKHNIEIDQRHAAAIFLVSGGYPDAYEKGKTIIGLDKLEGSLVFHAGTKVLDGKIVSSGGRVMAISSLGENMQEALAKSYKNAAHIDFEGKNYRRDLGQDLLHF
jgi:phosphoribosylamine--glycine ligase